ncbi:MAG: hypothetical protein Fur0021_14530 [Candidatus Promineifilaceae bacterium]
MSTGSILLGFALFVGVAFVLAYPFLLPKARQRPAAGSSARQQLLAEKEMLLTRLRGLDFDYETGKIPADVYESQRLSLKAETAAVLQALDRMPADPHIARIDNEIEAAINRRRQRTARIPSATAADEIEAAIARRRQIAGKTPSLATAAAAPAVYSNSDGALAARFCPQCGQATDAGDKFCARCGAALA